MEFNVTFNNTSDISWRWALLVEDSEKVTDKVYHKMLVNLVKRLQRRFSGNRPTKNKNCLWRPCLVTDRDEMSIFLIDWPSIDASYQVSVHLVKRFQRRFLEIDQPETRIASGGHVC
jgi:hypothetical protein